MDPSKSCENYPEEVTSNSLPGVLPQEAPCIQENMLIIDFVPGSGQSSFNRGYDAQAIILAAASSLILVSSVWMTY